MNDLEAVAAGFLFGSVATAPLMAAGWYVWSAADVDCLGDVWACRQQLILPTIARIGLPLVLWEYGVLALARAWMRHG